MSDGSNGLSIILRLNFRTSRVRKQFFDVVTFFNKYHVVMLQNGGQNMAKRSRKAKATGKEMHRQLKRAKKMQKKQKKNVELPKRHRKGRK